MSSRIDSAQMNKKILLVFTGGTIGSLVSHGCIKTTDSNSSVLLQLFNAHYPDSQRVQFKTIRPLNLLSENLHPAVWQNLLTTITAEQPEQYDGIIITHGTDTLSYTAAALSFYFHALKVPLLLVSSDYPLSDSKANGWGNFSCAVDFISQVAHAGVFVPYRNTGQSSYVHLGTRLISCLPLSNDFISIQHKSFLCYENRQFTTINPLPTKPTHPLITLKPLFSKRVLLIRPYPGLNYQSFNLDQVDVVLHDLYHSGTACVASEEGEDYSLLDFIDRCQQQSVKIYLAPIIKSDTAYLSTHQLIAAGANVIWNMTIEAAYVKLLLAYGNFTQALEIERFLASHIAHEYIGV